MRNNGMLSGLFGDSLALYGTDLEQRSGIHEHISLIGMEAGKPFLAHKATVRVRPSSYTSRSSCRHFVPNLITSL